MAQATISMSSLPPQGAALFPAAAVRSDPGVLLTSARFLGLEMAMTGLIAGTLTVGDERCRRCD